MKTSLVKNTAFGLLLMSGIALTSCKDNNAATTEGETTTDTLETTQTVTPESNDSIVTQTDSITRTTREVKPASGGDQVP